MVWLKTLSYSTCNWNIKSSYFLKIQIVAQPSTLTYQTGLNCWLVCLIIFNFKKIVFLFKILIHSKIALQTFKNIVGRSLEFQLVLIWLKIWDGIQDEFWHGGDSLLAPCVPWLRHQVLAAEMKIENHNNSISSQTTTTTPAKRNQVICTVRAITLHLPRACYHFATNPGTMRRCFCRICIHWQLDWCDDDDDNDNDD